MKLFKKQRPSVVLGISLDAGRLEAVVVRRNGGSLQIRQTASAALALSPLTGDPELVGREIRNQLDAAGIRERNCAVCLPLTWVLTLQVKIPAEMSEADLASYLQIEAERGFPASYESLFIANSRFKTPNGDLYATLLAVPRNHLALLERALRAAKLKPLTFAMGISAIQGPSQQPNQRVMTLSLGSHGLELLVAGGGGIIALRSLDAAVESEGAHRHIASDLVAREVRITIGQLPGGFAESGGVVKVFGDGELTRQFITEVSPRLTALGLRVEPMDRPAAVTYDNAPAPNIAGSPVLALASAFVNSGDIGPDFLPPKVSPLKQFVTSKLGTQKFAYAGAAAAFVVVCVCAAFGWQQLQIMNLDSQWNKIADTVNTVTNQEAQISKYRPWFDTSLRGLVIMAKIANAYPRTGDVTVKSLEIRDLNEINCSGTARSQAAFNLMRENLGKVTEVKNLHSETRGQPPAIQFTITYEWQPAEGGTPNGN